MKKPVIIALIILAVCLFGCSTKTEKGITVVSTEEIETLKDLDNVQLVDVRTPREYNSGHLSNSQNIDFYSPTFEEDIAQLDKEKPVILYCRIGGRSAKCAEKMLKAGFKKIYDLKGGYSEWEHVDLDLNP